MILLFTLGFRRSNLFHNSTENSVKLLSVSHNDEVSQITRLNLVIYREILNLPGIQLAVSTVTITSDRGMCKQSVFNVKCRDLSDNL